MKTQLRLLKFICFVMCFAGILSAGEHSAPAQIHYPAETQKTFKGPEEWFTGDVKVKLLFPQNGHIAFSGAYVTFQPGARTAWHLHPAGQHMIVTDGVCLTGTRDGKIVECKAGETVWCPPDIDHWHGATSDKAMTHLVITGVEDGQNVIWKEKVTDAQYLSKAPNTTENKTMNINEHLNKKQQAMIFISAFAASGDLEKLKPALNEGLDAGLTINEIKEILVHLYAYAGFPRSLNALSTFMAVVQERKAKGITDEVGKAATPLPAGTNSLALGEKVQTELVGKSVTGPLFDFAPVINDYLKSHLFGDIFGRDVLDQQSREFVTVAALSNMDGVVPQLKAHLAIAKNVGVTETQLNALAAMLEQKVGKKESNIIVNGLCMTEKWDKTFPKSDKVIHEKVSYRNRYGIIIAADMYLPKDIDKTKKHPAILVGTPYGGVKEQGAGIYAQTMAERGFVTVAFDESYNGKSGGEPRHISSPDIFVEDFSAGVDFLGTRPFVDRNRIGVIGICGSGGFAITAAQVDRRIKAIATASMYDMSRVIRKGWKDVMTAEERNKTLDQLGQQRWKDFENGMPEVPAGFPKKPLDVLPEGLDSISSEFFEYYGMKRGQHPRSNGPFSLTSNMAFMNFPLMNYIGTISPRPILFIIGENAHSRYFSEDAYKMASEPKELYIVPGARHIDLYDRMDMIPFDKLTDFFGKHL